MKVSTPISANDYVSGQIVNLTIAMVNLVSYNRIHSRSLCESIDCESSLEKLIIHNH